MSNKEQTVKELEEVINFIKSDDLNDSQKEKITKDTVNYFDNYVSPGWLKYRKSVSTNAAVVEWKGYMKYNNSQLRLQKCSFSDI